MHEPFRRLPRAGARWAARVPKLLVASMIAMLLLGPATPAPADAQSAATIEQSSRAALESLYRQNAGARALREKAKAVLVFPSMLKAGFMFGGQIGTGTLFREGRAVAYYNSVAASYGFQAGAQLFGYALFFMDESALSYLEKSGGFELGVGPSLVVVDAGMATSLTTSTLTQDIYAFVFDQAGLMGGVGIQGSKITKISK